MSEEEACGETRKQETEVVLFLLSLVSFYLILERGGEREKDATIVSY